MSKLLKNTALLSLSTLILMSLLCSCAYLSKTPEPLPPLTQDEINAMRLIGAELTPEMNIKIDNIIIHRREKEISFPALINMWEGDLEVVICTKKGRRHESLLVTDISPFQLQLALILSGAHNGALTPGGNIPQGDIVDIFVELPNGKRFAVEDWMYNTSEDRPKKKRGWVFVGSSFTHDTGCLATKEGNISNINSQDQNTILDRRLIPGHVNDMYVVYKEPLSKVFFKNPEKPTDEEYGIPVKVVLSVRKN